MLRMIFMLAIKFRWKRREGIIQITMRIHVYEMIELSLIKTLEFVNVSSYLGEKNSLEIIFVLVRMGQNSLAQEILQCRSASKMKCCDHRTPFKSARFFSFRFLSCHFHYSQPLLLYRNEWWRTVIPCSNYVIWWHNKFITFECVSILNKMALIHVIKMVWHSYCAECARARTTYTIKMTKDEDSWYYVCSNFFCWHWPHKLEKTQRFWKFVFFSFAAH